MLRNVLVAATVLVLAPASARAEVCRASYYSSGVRTASGVRFNPNGMTAAHRTLPFGTVLRVSRAGRAVTVIINDRGPFIRDRCLDLSAGAAGALGLTRAGVSVVTIERL